MTRTAGGTLLLLTLIAGPAYLLAQIARAVAEVHPFRTGVAVGLIAGALLLWLWQGVSIRLANRAALHDARVKARENDVQRVQRLVHPERRADVAAMERPDPYALAEPFRRPPYVRSIGAHLPSAAERGDVLTRVREMSDAELDAHLRGRPLEILGRDDEPEDAPYGRHDRRVMLAQRAACGEHAEAVTRG